MDDDALRESTLVALDAVARAMGHELDLAEARHALREAERAVPGPWGETWAERLRRVGEAVGLRIDPTARPSRELLERSYPLTPLLGFAETDEGPRWVVVTGHRDRRIEFEIHGDPSRRERPGRRWADADEVDRLVSGGGVGPSWAMVQPLAPLDAMRAERAELESPQPPTPLARLIALMRPEKEDLWAIFIYTVAIGILSLAVPLAVEGLVATVALGTTYQQLVTLSVMLFIALAFGMLLRVIRYYVMEIIQRRLYVRIVSDVSYRLPRSKLEAFDRRHGPELVNRFFEFVQIQKLTSLLLLDALTLVISGLIGMILLAFYHPYLLVYDLVMIALIIYIVFISGRGAIKTVIQESHAKYETADWLEELVRHPLAFRTGGGPDLARERADTVARHWLRARRLHFQVVFNQVINAHGLQVIAATAMLGLGGWMVLGGQLTLGQLVAAELIIAVAANSLIYLAKHFEGFYDLMAAMEKLGYLTDLPLQPHAGEQHRVDPGLGAALAVREVSYRYDDHGEHGGHDEHRHGHALHGVDLEVGPGERVALIGPDGSGRSTLVDLMAGLRDPSSGRVLYDGADLRDVHPEQRREQLAVVRGAEVIEGTLIENVRMGREGLSLDDVIEALDRVGLLGELDELPGGLQAELTTGGRPLSEGQARRLTIARALVGNPRLLVFDQTLDALDPGARERVLDAVFDPARSWTVVVVTHGADIASRCDRTVTISGDPPPEGFGVGPIPAAALGEHGGDELERPYYMKEPKEAPEVPPRGRLLPALRLVQSLGPARRLGKVLGVAMLLTPIAMAFVPWRQAVPGRGRVIAYNPQDRQQPVKAPITGRVMRWWVVEGSHVSQGDRIFEMEDNDPDYLRRLELLLEAARERMRATEAKRRAFEEVAKALIEARDRAAETARKQLDIAVQRVEIARQNLQAAEAILRAAAPDYERKRRGSAEGLVSVQDFQFAERAFIEARAAVDRNLAEVGAANDEVAARAAELERVRAETQSRVDAARADAGTAQNELAEAQQAVTVAEVDLQRQSRQLVLAPRDGTIFRILTGQDTDIVGMGEPVALLVPDYPDPMSRTVELWVNGRDMPLIEPGREVRLQFEGWPAVQFIGWPSVAIGTFPGRVALVDPTDDGTGRFRVLISPPPGQADAWPAERFLRQGVLVQGWVLLRHVTLGYEVWRRINGFPPYVAMERPTRAT